MYKSLFGLAKEMTPDWVRLDEGPEMPMTRTPAFPGSGLGRDEARESVICSPEDLDRARMLGVSLVEGFTGGWREREDPVSYHAGVLRTWSYSGKVFTDCVCLIEEYKDKIVVTKIRH